MRRGWEKAMHCEKSREQHQKLSKNKYSKEPLALSGLSAITDIQADERTDKVICKVICRGGFAPNNNTKIPVKGANCLFYLWTVA